MEPQTIRLNDEDYPVAALSPAGRETLDLYRFAEEQLKHLRNMEAILNKARNAYIADLKHEIVRGRTGLDLSDLLSDD